jgi:WD40 repeat protein
MIFDVERKKVIRIIKSHTNRVTSISWNRSALCPYLITSGSANNLIINHDIRVKWSTNYSYD